MAKHQNRVNRQEVIIEQFLLLWELVMVHLMLLCSSIPLSFCPSCPSSCLICLELYWPNYSTCDPSRLFYICFSFSIKLFIIRDLRQYRHVRHVNNKTSTEKVFQVLVIKTLCLAIMALLPVSLTWY